MKRLSFILSLLFFGSVVFAAEPVPEDFAFGLIVEAPGAEAIYSLTVPEDVYRGIYRDDLADMRMYNARGELVPHMLRRPAQAGTVKKAIAPAVTLPFFPVYETENMAGGTACIHVETNESGVVVDVKSSDSAANDSRLSAYIIDASMLEQRPSGLRIAWEGNVTSFSVLVNVEGSDDLNRWHTMTRDAALVELNFGGQHLMRQIIELPASSAKYMRLSWPPKARGSSVLLVEALFHDELSVNRQVRQWVDIEGHAVDEEIRANEYTTDAKFPVDAVNIQLPERNSLMLTVVKSRNDEQSEWRKRVHGMFYKLTVDGVMIENSPYFVNCAAARYWRFETRSLSGIGRKVPVLQLGWIPHELLFVARGEGPFTLAYGSAVVKRSEQPLDAMLAVLSKKSGRDSVKEAHIKQTIVLGGEKCLLPPAPPLPWKTWILWAVLIGGVAILGVMVWRLYCQMNTPEKSE